MMMIRTDRFSQKLANVIRIQIMHKEKIYRYVQVYKYTIILLHIYIFKFKEFKNYSKMNSRIIHRLIQKFYKKLRKYHIILIIKQT